MCREKKREMERDGGGERERKCEWNSCGWTCGMDIITIWIGLESIEKEQRIDRTELNTDKST